MTEAKDRVRQDQSELLAALRLAGADVSRPTAIRCPFHEDKNASANIYADAEGVWRFKCHAAACDVCLDVFDVRERATGQTVDSQLADLRKRDEPAAKPPRTFDSIERWQASFPHPTTAYRYTNPDTGAIELVKLRVETPEGKTFRQAHFLADGRLIEKKSPGLQPIYNRTRLKSAEQVVMVEGEKCVHAVTDAGYVATCCPGGGTAGSAAAADLSPLAGKTVLLWPDHDPVKPDGDRVGHQHMREVAEQLKLVSPPCSIWWINPDLLKLGDKEDVSDYLAGCEASAKGDAMSDALDLAVPMGGSSELQDFINDVLSGKRKTVSFPFRGLSKLTRALMPGTVTVMVGAPGSTKSMMICQSLIHWQKQGVPAAAFMLEDDRRFHLHRILAQLDGNEKLTDEEWMLAYPAEVQAAMGRHSGTIDIISRTMADAPEDSITYDQVLTWMQRVAEGGARVIVVDPITAIDAGKTPWESDRQFMAKAKSILRKFGASLVLVTHPRGGNSKPGHDDAAGSRAFGRFSQTMFWITRPDKAEKCRVHDISSKLPVMTWADRYLVLAKVRNAKGQGMRLAYQFKSESLTFEEVGVLIKVIKGKDGDDDSGD